MDLKPIFFIVIGDSVYLLGNIINKNQYIAVVV